MLQVRGPVDLAIILCSCDSHGKGCNWQLISNRFKQLIYNDNARGVMSL
jgi:hypothetical protein